MIEPVFSHSILTAAIAGAAIVLSGCLYAGLFAYARLGNRQDMMIGAYVAYSILIIAVLVLAKVLNLNGYWSGILIIMLAGYLAGPHAIWKLCVSTHKNESPIDTNTFSGSDS